MLSPEMLYLLLWSAALLWIVTECRRSFRPHEFLLTGAATAFLCYLDAAGFLLLLFVGGVLLCRREKNPGSGRKALALLLFLLGVLSCFAACVAADAWLSRKTFAGVLSAWLCLYSPGSFSIPVALENVRFPADYIILACVTVFGIFSFWRDRTRDTLTVWVLGAAAAVIAGCFGIFTEYMPIGLYLYLFVIILAGIGAEECFRRPEPEIMPAKGGEAGEELSLNWEESGNNTEGESEEPEFLDLAPLPGARRKPVRLIENPLPLPKKHEKRSLDYNIRTVDEKQDDFDLQIDENDDFDI